MDAGENVVFMVLPGPDYAGSLLFFFENGKGPFIQASLNDFPGRTAPVRVDSGKVRLQEDARGIVGDLINGQTALVTYNVWPTGQERMSVQVAGFAEAYTQLKAIAGVK